MLHTSVHETWEPTQMMVRILAALLLSLSVAGCERSQAAVGTPVPSTGVPTAVSPQVPLMCAAQIDAILTTPSLPGAPSFDRARREFLGRARAEPMLFVREPTALSEEALPIALRSASRTLREGTPGGRVAKVFRQFKGDRAALRKLLLREGYLYAPNPMDALTLTAELHIADLFDEPEVWLQRGAKISEIHRKKIRGGATYVYAEGDRKGRIAELIFGDRITRAREELATPLHRDLRELSEREGFDRARILHRNNSELVAELRFGNTWARAKISSNDARIFLDCIDGDQAKILQWKEATQGRRVALQKLSNTVTTLVDDGLRFDRPEGEKTADRDGHLRPVWLSSYLHGGSFFEVDGHSYPVFDTNGNPWPPEVCMDFVTDSFERASGTWFARRGEPPKRTVGLVDFSVLSKQNRRAVLGFEKFAASFPDLFDVHRFQGDERIPFQRRTDFFRALEENADLFQPGDVLAIQGRKRDGLIHQHAILLERTDPITGFPYGLADQMKRPRRRTYEGIMAEAPLRSMLYRIRPGDPLFGLNGGTNKVASQ